LYFDEVKSVTEFWRSPDIPQLESRRSCQAVSCYRPHTHERFSIGLIDAGRAVFAGAAGSPVALEPGDVLLIPAATVHSCNQQEGLWEYQMIHADQEWIGGLLPDGATELLHGIRVFRDTALHGEFSRINDRLFDGAEPGQVRRSLGEALRQCAARVPFFHELRDPDEGLSTRLAPVLDRLRNDPTNPALEDLVELCGMSKYQLIRAVKEFTGLSPLAWRLNERVIAAREMLRDGRTLSDTAHELGFTDQSHFHRVFRAHVAATPGTYRG